MHPIHELGGALVEPSPSSEVSARRWRLGGHPWRRAVMLFRELHEVDDESQIALRVDANRDPVRPAWTQMYTRIGLELIPPVTNDGLRQAHLDDSVRLEMGDLFAVDPVGRPIAEHR